MLCQTMTDLTYKGALDLRQNLDQSEMFDKTLTWRILLFAGLIC